MVRSILDGVITPGEHTVDFDGRDSAGNSLPSGIYFVRMETPEVMQIRQVTLLK
jgi:flagellar hook assembly protein FlgD